MCYHKNSCDPFTLPLKCKSPSKFTRRSDCATQHESKVGMFGQIAENPSVDQTILESKGHLSDSWSLEPTGHASQGTMIPNTKANIQQSSLEIMAQSPDQNLFKMIISSNCWQTWFSKLLNYAANLVLHILLLLLNK